MSGQCGDAYGAGFGSEWTDGFEGIQLEGLKFTLVQKLQIHLSIFPVTACGIITSAGQSLADTE